jgi:hypothetical protein
MALAITQAREGHLVRRMLLALTGSSVTPLALYALWQAGADPHAELFGALLLLGMGMFIVLVRDLWRGSGGRRQA